MNSLTFLYVVYAISIVLLLLTIIVRLSLNLPKQLEQFKYEDGLNTLKNKIIAKEILLILICIIAIFCLLSRYIINEAETARYIIVFLVFLFSFFLFVDSVVGSSIYRDDYTQRVADFRKKLVIKEQKTKVHTNS